MRYSQTRLAKSKRRSGTSVELCILYEKKILMLVLYRALKEGYDFTLDTSIEGAGIFDDVIFTYKESDGIEQRIYLQAIHKMTENKKITYNDCLKQNDSYALYRFFISYIETVRNFNEIRNMYFIIYTNIDFNCPREDDKGYRILRKSEAEYFLLRKLDLSEHKPLEVFSVIDPGNERKNPAFYKFSDINQNGEDEKSRFINYLKNEFKTTDYWRKNLMALDENELESMLEGFFDSLIFAVDQLNEEKLGNRIKEEIKHDHPDSLTEDHIDYIAEYTLEKISVWKNRTKAVPLTEMDNFFRQVEEKLMIFSLSPVEVETFTRRSYNYMPYIS